LVREVKTDYVEHALDGFEDALFWLPTRRVLLATFFWEVLIQCEDAAEQRCDPI
jgi:hypothetical protein